MYLQKKMSVTSKELKFWVGHILSDAVEDFNDCLGFARHAHNKNTLLHIYI